MRTLVLAALLAPAAAAQPVSPHRCPEAGCLAIERAGLGLRLVRGEPAEPVDRAWVVAVPLDLSGAVADVPEAVPHAVAYERTWALGWAAALGAGALFTVGALRDRPGTADNGGTPFWIGGAAAAVGSTVLLHRAARSRTLALEAYNGSPMR